MNDAVHADAVPVDATSGSTSHARRRARRHSGEGRGALVRFVVSHFGASIGEWGVLIGLLVYAYSRGGETAVGVASVVTTSPYLLLASPLARLVERLPPTVVRTGALLTMAAAFGGAGLAALLAGPLWVPVALCTIGIAGYASIRSAGAVILPAIVRTSRELTTANVWIGHAQSASTLAGPTLATVLLAVGGPGASLLGCGACALVGGILSAVDIRRGPAPERRNGERHTSAGRRLLLALVVPFTETRNVGRRPGARGPLLVELAQSALVGAFDIIIVVIALDRLDLGEAGAGLLTMLFGAGALLSIVVADPLARRQRLAPVIVVCIAVLAATCAALGVSITLVTACVVLPLSGIARSLLDLLTAVLLQRSAPPAELASVFGALETTSGAGLLVGSILAQVLIGVSGVQYALVGLAVAFSVVLVSVWRALKTADAAADVPVVAMSLLRRLPLFAQLPTITLESVARSAVERPTRRGDVIIRQGDPGDRFYAVAKGTFDVSISGHHARSMGRGDGFGEVALLADVPRTATVTAIDDGLVLAVERGPFLLAVTGHIPAQDAAWDTIAGLTFDGDAPSPAEPWPAPETG
jgi:hypothetical protein